MSEARPRVRILRPDEAPPPAPFVRALRDGDGPASAFVERMPSGNAAWREALAAVSMRRCAFDPVVAEAVLARQRRAGLGAASLEAARQLVTGEAVAVVTGQQPALYGGALLTAHKIAGAISLARRLTALGGPPVVAVFWSATEDHDLDEANRLGVLDRGGVAQRLAATIAPDGRSLEHLASEAIDLGAVHAALREALPATARADAILGRIAPRPAEGFVDHAHRALGVLFADCGVVLLDPFDLLPATGADLAALVRDGASVCEGVREAGARQREAGVPAPLDPAPDALPLFVRPSPSGPRRRPASADLDALAREVAERPDLASGDVIGRVLIQNAHLPVVATVVGPTEAAYLAQIRAAERARGRPFPILVPRPEATWVDRKTEERLAAFGLDAASVLRAGPRLEPPGLAADAAWERAMEAHLAAAPPEVRAVLDAGGEPAAALRRGLEATRRAWEKAAAAVRSARAAEAGRAGGRFARAVEVVWPRGRPQERFLSPWSLAARYGLAAVRAGLEALDPLAAGPHLVERFESDPADG